MRLQRSFRDTLRTLFLHVNFVFPYLSKNVFKKAEYFVGQWLLIDSSLFEPAEGYKGLCLCCLSIFQTYCTGREPDVNELKQ